MSLFKFGNLEAEIDFTDVLFLENLEDAKQAMKEEAARVPKTGKILFVHNASVTLIFLTELSEKVHMKKCFRGKSA